MMGTLLKMEFANHYAMIIFALSAMLLEFAVNVLKEIMSILQQDYAKKTAPSILFPTASNAQLTLFARLV